jgi:hypothetical protein
MGISRHGLLYVLAKKQAETVRDTFTSDRSLTLSISLDSSLHLVVHALGRQGLRALAWPGTACELARVSKVFLRHVAPTRYGDHWARPYPMIGRGCHSRAGQALSSAQGSLSLAA